MPKWAEEIKESAVAVPCLPGVCLDQFPACLVKVHKFLPSWGRLVNWTVKKTQTIPGGRPRYSLIASYQNPAVDSEYEPPIRGAIEQEIAALCKGALWDVEIYLNPVVSADGEENGEYGVMLTMKKRQPVTDQKPATPQYLIGTNENGIYADIFQGVEKVA